MTIAGTIALLTDFGNDDYFVGAMKGVILSVNPLAAIVDITHNVRPQDIRSAAFTLSACRRDFPVGTIFVAVVDPGVGSERRAILAEAEGRFYVAPDNGLLSFVFEEARENDEKIRVFELSNERFFRDQVSRTFHGRDIFAPVAAHLSKGVEPAEFGPEISDFVVTPFVQPTKEGGRTEAEIIHIDRFGNLITNLRPEALPERFAITVGFHEVRRLVQTFSEAARGEIVAMAGSAGYIEIAANRGSAASLQDAETGNIVLVRELDET
jgi:S-adenosylmethionine hydrolase